VLAAIGEQPAANLETLTAYGRAYSDVAELRRQWRADPRAVLTGPRGGIVVNPLLREIVRAERRLASIGHDLGLDPQARRLLGRRAVGGRLPGENLSADRSAKVIAMPPRRTPRG
jgi:phage terminase small subunit